MSRSVTQSLSLVDRHRDLDHLRAGPPHRAHARLEVDWQPVEIMGREHDALAAGRRDQVVESGARFDVHVLRAGGQRLGEQPFARFLGSGERAAFPCRTAGDDDRQPAAGQRAGRRPDR